ncbi:hypothetical protein F183_A03200 [Bryobacterales bacterium F-183]|nr:hypothetical protein F183_A03200 [Bryobacterales bacterium F-183]
MTATLSIAAATLIFSIVDPFLLRPMPYDANSRVFHIWELNRKQQGAAAQVLSSPARLEQYRAGLNANFAAFTGFYRDSMTWKPANAAPIRVEAMRFLPGYFDVFPAQAQLGRTVQPQEEKHGGPKAAVVSHRFWQTQLNGDPAALNSRLKLGDDVYTIVGILPADFQYPTRRTDLYVPAQLHPNVFQFREAEFLSLVGRLRDGVSLAAAQSELESVYQRLQVSDPQPLRGRGLNMLSLRDYLVGANTKLTLWTMLSAVALVLLIACGNIASLMVARAASRQREFAVRIAMGGSSADLVRRVVAENLILFAAAGIFGTLLAVWLLDAMRTLPLPLPGFATMRIDYRIILFTAGATLLTALIASIAPALSQVREDLHARLKQLGGRGSTQSRQNVRKLIVAGEVALAMLLLVCSGLIGRSFLQLSKTDLGYATGDRLTFSLDYPWEADRDRIYGIQKQVLTGLAAMPGVSAAGFTNFLPLRSGLTTQRAYPAGRPAPPSNQWAAIDSRTVSRGYFQAIGIPLVAGEPLPDGNDKRNGVLINQTLARALYPGTASPVGQTLLVHTGAPKPGEFLILGVTGDSRNADIAEAPRPTIYYNFHQNVWPIGSFVIAVQPGLDPASLANAVRQVVAQSDPNQAVTELQTMSTLVGRDLVRPRLNMVVVSVFALAAVLLTGLGLYGVIAVTVASQTREIGLRLALGAQQKQVAAWLITGSGRIVLAGLLTGTAASYFAARWLASNLYGTNPGDPFAWTAAITVLLLVSLAAVAIPARRAMQIAPTEALRDE